MQNQGEKRVGQVQARKIRDIITEDNFKRDVWHTFTTKLDSMEKGEILAEALDRWASANLIDTDNNIDPSAYIKHLLLTVGALLTVGTVGARQLPSSSVGMPSLLALSLQEPGTYMGYNGPAARPDMTPTYHTTQPTTQHKLRKTEMTTWQHGAQQPREALKRPNEGDPLYACQRDINGGTSEIY